MNILCEAHNYFVVFGWLNLIEYFVIYFIQILTKDSVTITVDAVVYYRINNPMMSVTKIMDASSSTRLLAMTTLRNILGTKTLSEILTDRESVSHLMQVIYTCWCNQVHIMVSIRDPIYISILNLHQTNLSKIKPAKNSSGGDGIQDLLRFIL